MVAPFPSVPKDQLRSMPISAMAVEKFGIVPDWLLIKDTQDRGFHETTHDKLLRHCRNTGGQGCQSQFLFDVDHLFLLGQGGHVSYFPDGRKTLFRVGVVQDFHDGIGHQITVFFQQPVGYSVWSTGLPWIKWFEESGIDGINLLHGKSVLIVF